MRSQRKLKLSSILLCHLLLLCLIPTFVLGTCTYNDQCGDPASPMCLSGTCGLCTLDTHCTTYVPGTIHCIANGLCSTACSTSADCTNPKLPACSASGYCTVCYFDSDCTSNLNFGTGYKCLSSNRCVAPCNTDTDCTNPLASVCGTSHPNKCNMCSDDSGCSHLTLTPYCISGDSCVECTSNTHCASGTCSNNKCICSSNSDCTQSTLSRCYHDVCQSCSADSDCTHISGKPSCTSGKCQALVISATATSSGDITDGDIIIGVIFGSIAGIVLVVIVVFKILSWQKQRKALQSKAKASSMSSKSPSDVTSPVHSESAPINQEINIKNSL